jgi:hypothetical protein
MKGRIHGLSNAVYIPPVPKRPRAHMLADWVRAVLLGAAASLAVAGLVFGPHVVETLWK